MATYSNQVDSVMLLIFKGDHQLEQLIELASSVSKHFNARILISCLESETKTLEKTISSLRIDHKTLPLIQVCPIEGAFVEGALHEAHEYGVRLLLVQANPFSRSHRKITQKLSSNKVRLLEKSELPVLMLPYGMSTKSISFKIFLQLNEQMQKAA